MPQLILQPYPRFTYVHSSLSNPSVASPTSQLILQPLFRSSYILQAFSHFTYVTAHSPTVLSLLLRHRIFTYVTWRAAHDLGSITSRITCPGWGLFGVFSSTVIQISGKLRPQPSPDITGHHNHENSFIAGGNDLRCWRALIHKKLGCQSTTPVAPSQGRMRWNETKWMRWVWRNGGMKFVGKTSRKTYPDTALSTSKPTWSDREANSGPSSWEASE